MQTRVGLDAEYSVIGCLLLKPCVLGELITLVREDDFIASELQTLYHAAAQLFQNGKHADPVALRDVVGKAYEALMMDCMGIVPSPSAWRGYVTTMLEQTRVHRMRMLAEGLANIQSTEEARDIIAQAGEILSVKNHNRVVTIQQAFQTFDKEQTENRSFLRFGFDKLDKRTYSDYGDFVVVAGRPSAGKTALALEMAATLSTQAKVGFYSLETRSSKLFDRMVSSQSIVSFSDIKQRRINFEHKQRIAMNKDHMLDMKLEFIEAAGMTVAEMLAIALARGHKVIIVDYLQLVKSKGRDRYEQVTNVSVELHRMAQSHGILVIALSQLSRNGNGVPAMTDLRESGQIEQDADVILALYQPDPENDRVTRKLRVLKNKEGTLGELDLYFDGDLQSFSMEFDELEMQLETKAHETYEQTKIG